VGCQTIKIICTFNIDISKKAKTNKQKIKNNKTQIHLLITTQNVIYLTFMTTWLAVQSVITGSTTAVQQTPQKKVFLTIRSFVAIVKISRCQIHLLI
jgi:hypothetical protein